MPIFLRKDLTSIHWPFSVRSVKLMDSVFIAFVAMTEHLSEATWGKKFLLCFMVHGGTSHHHSSDSMLGEVVQSKAVKACGRVCSGIGGPRSRNGNWVSNSATTMTVWNAWGPKFNPWYYTNQELWWMSVIPGLLRWNTLRSALATKGIWGNAELHEIMDSNT